MCPDCNVQADEHRHLAHDTTCPIGLGSDQQMADDRLWFTLHPRETERRRSPHWSEIAQLRAYGALPPAEVGSVEGDVVVTWVADGIRAKRFSDLWIAHTGTRSTR